MPKSQPSKSTPTPKTKPSAAKIAATIAKIEEKLVVDACRGPIPPKLSGKALEQARRGGFC